MSSTFAVQIHAKVYDRGEAKIFLLSHTPTDPISSDPTVFDPQVKTIAASVARFINDPETQAAFGDSLPNDIEISMVEIFPTGRVHSYAMWVSELKPDPNFPRRNWKDFVADALALILIAVHEKGGRV